MNQIANTTAITNNTRNIRRIPYCDCILDLSGPWILHSRPAYQQPMKKKRELYDLIQLFVKMYALVCINYSNVSAWIVSSTRTTILFVWQKPFSDSFFAIPSIHGTHIMPGWTRKILYIVVICVFIHANTSFIIFDSAFPLSETTPFTFK